MYLLNLKSAVHPLASRERRNRAILSSGARNGDGRCTPRWRLSSACPRVAPAHGNAQASGARARSMFGMHHADSIPAISAARPRLLRLAQSRAASRSLVGPHEERGGGHFRISHCAACRALPARMLCLSVCPAGRFVLSVGARGLYTCRVPCASRSVCVRVPPLGGVVRLKSEASVSVEDWV